MSDVGTCDYEKLATLVEKGISGDMSQLCEYTIDRGALDEEDKSLVSDTVTVLLEAGIHDGCADDLIAFMRQVEQMEPWERWFHAARPDHILSGTQLAKLAAYLLSIAEINVA